MRLSQWLTENNLTHAEMADRIGGVTAEAVRLWAAGRRMPEVRSITRILEVTENEVTLLDLYDARLERLNNEPIEG
jgi:transcriptional regulator with XRE-family HTH domain